MQRMYEEKRLQLERGSIGGSYFMVQLPDGTMEKRMKLPLNADPGVHSSLNLDQLAQQSGLHPVPTLPTITEARIPEQTPNDTRNESKKRPTRIHRNSESDGSDTGSKIIPRNASQPAFTNQTYGLPKNGSVPTFDRIRKTSQGERFKPSLAAIKANSRGNISNNGDVCLFIKIYFKIKLNLKMFF